jgi:hypothetical protein
MPTIPDVNDVVQEYLTNPRFLRLLRSTLENPEAYRNFNFRQVTEVMQEADVNEQIMVLALASLKALTELPRETLQEAIARLEEEDE